MVIQSQHGPQKVHALLQTSLFQVLLGDWEEIAEVHKHFSAHTHETSFRPILCRFENNVRFQVTDNLIVAENGVLRQKHEVCDLEFIVHCHCTLLNEVDLPEFLPIGHNSCVRFVYPSEHVNN
jgi:hypothetical protein